ncbi:hypothetical protein EV401DRAFT_189296 [Pisolithus croceorrhizus]|nr:hypothetical protein EV401DRAFT_189296 [Pisolithus croceorrhizus]
MECSGHLFTSFLLHFLTMPTVLASATAVRRTIRRRSFLSLCFVPIAAGSADVGKTANVTRGHISTICRRAIVDYNIRPSQLKPGLLTMRAHIPLLVPPKKYLLRMFA